MIRRLKSCGKWVGEKDYNSEYHQTSGEFAIASPVFANPIMCSPMWMQQWTSIPTRITKATDFWPKVRKGDPQKATKY